MVSGTRFLTRVTLGSAFSAATAIPVAAFIFRGPNQPETWAVAAAALAVITSAISAWSTRRVLELQEDARRPNPCPMFDLTSRYQLAMLRIKNTGGGTAHNITLNWNTPLLDHDGKTIGFCEGSEVPVITTLLPGESISQAITAAHSFIATHPNGAYTGATTFEDAVGTKYKVSFRLDGRQHARSPTYEDEGSRTHYQIQKIPDELRKIRSLLEQLTRT